MPVEEGGHQGNASSPDYFEKYLDSLRSEGRAHSEQAEREAYAKMESQIAREKNGEVRQFMQETLEHYCQDGSMLLSYLYENRWHEWIKDQRSLQKQVQPIELFISIESILANRCDSSGYMKTARQLRYPLTIPGNYTSSPGVRNVDPNVPRARFLNSYYQFGVHKFQVGRAIKGSSTTWRSVMGSISRNWSGLINALRKESRDSVIGSRTLVLQSSTL